MFDLCILEQDGEIPPVFRTGLLKQDTGSELSRLMSELQKDKDGETSMDSKMDDTPANYNQINQRFEGDGNEQPIPEYN